tara:strand:- start:613 stop:804 length:192 start_codon:yes stop_codon:yes gene_type:complete
MRKPKPYDMGGKTYKNIPNQIVGQDRKYKTKNSNYRPGRAHSMNEPVRVPAVEESLMKDDNLG